MGKEKKKKKAGREREREVETEGGRKEKWMHVELITILLQSVKSRSISI